MSDRVAKKNTSRREVLKGLAAGGLLASAGLPRITMAAGPKPTALIIGAGIAGLSAAYDLRRSGFDVTIFEKREWSGGRMREAFMGPLYGFTHAAGVSTAYREMFALAKELGIEHDLGGDTGMAPIENEHGWYEYTAKWDIDAIRRIPGLSRETKKKLPLLQPDLDRIRQEVDPCLLATGAGFDDESLGDYYDRMLGKKSSSEIQRYWVEPALEWWGWPMYQTSKLAMLSWYSQQQYDFHIPRGGIGVLTRKLASILPIQSRTTVRFITPPDASGRHVVHYLTPEFEPRTVAPDVVVVATEGKFVYPLVHGLTAAEEAFFKSIDFTKEAIIHYVLNEKAAPKAFDGGRYIPSHPDPFKARVSSWDVNPAEPDNHNRPPTARVALSRPETPKWQVSNQPIEKYCEPLIKHFYPAFDMRNVVDIVNYTCDDLIYQPVGYARQLAGVVRNQEKQKRGLYFAGEYMAAGHTGGACASGRAAARLIARHWR